MVAAAFAHEQLDVLTAERPGFGELVGAALRSMRALGDEQLRQVLMDALALPQEGDGVSGGAARLAPAREQQLITPARSDGAGAPARGHDAEAPAPAPAAATAAGGAAAQSSQRLMLRSSAVDEGSSEGDEDIPAGDGDLGDSGSDDDSDGEFEWFGVSADYEREPGVAEARGAVAAMLGAAAGAAEAQAAGGGARAPGNAAAGGDDDEFADLGTLAAAVAEASRDSARTEEGRAQPADAGEAGEGDAGKAGALVRGDVLQRAPNTQGYLLPVPEEDATDSDAGTNGGASAGTDTGNGDALERLRARANDAAATAEEAWKRVPRSTPRSSGIGARSGGPARPSDSSSAGSTGVLGMAGLNFKPKFSSERPPSLDDAFLRGIGNSGAEVSGAIVFDSCPPPPAQTNGPDLDCGGACGELPFSRETNNALKRALEAVSQQYSPKR